MFTFGHWQKGHFWAGSLVSVDFSFSFTVERLCVHVCACLCGFHDLYYTSVVQHKVFSLIWFEIIWKLESELWFRSCHRYFIVGSELWFRSLVIDISLFDTTCLLKYIFKHVVVTCTLIKSHVSSSGCDFHLRWLNSYLLWRQMSSIN